MAKQKIAKSTLSRQARAIIARAKAWRVQMDAFTAGVLIEPGPSVVFAERKPAVEQPKEPKEAPFKKALRTLRSEKTEKARKKQRLLEEARGPEDPSSVSLGGL